MADRRNYERSWTETKKPTMLEPNGSLRTEPPFRLSAKRRGFLVDGVLTVDGDKIFGTHRLTLLHDRDSCGNGRYPKRQSCTIHNPSDHVMREWPLIWDPRNGMFWRLCPHYIAHPDPDSYVHQAVDLGSVPNSHDCCDECKRRARCVDNPYGGSVYEDWRDASRG